MDAFAWPLAVVVLVVIFLVIFNRQIRRLLDRTESIGKIGLKTFPRGREIVQTQAEAGQAHETPVGTDTEALLRQMDTPLILDRDAAIRKDLDKLANQGDREKVLVRHLAGALIVNKFDRDYGSILGSQIGALAALNSAGREGLPMEDIRRFYDDAAATYPEAYEGYSFEQWTDYLRTSALVADVKSGIAITLWGNEFLVHLARSRRPVYKMF